MSDTEHLRRELDNSVYAFRCRRCGAAWKVYQQERHHMGCDTPAHLRWMLERSGR